MYDFQTSGLKISRVRFFHGSSHRKTAEVKMSYAKCRIIPQKRNNGFFAPQLYNIDRMFAADLLNNRITRIDFY